MPPEGRLRTVTARLPTPSEVLNERIGPEPVRSFAFDDELAPLYTVGQVCDMLLGSNIGGRLAGKL